MTVDSYVVFFERIKDELRSGRTLKNAAPRSWNATWRTIWAANVVSIIGAVILFMLSVGSVRGFALYLGVTTFCDLVILYTFTRPLVLLLAIERLHGDQIGLRDQGGGVMNTSEQISKSRFGRLLQQPDGDRLLRPAQGRLHRRRSSIVRHHRGLAVHPGTQPRPRLRGRQRLGRAGQRHRSTSTRPSRCCTDNGIDTAEARIQRRIVRGRPTSITIEIEEVPSETAAAITADVRRRRRRRASARSAWRSPVRPGVQEITEKAIRALIVFFIAVSLFISLRFEWRMAVAAFAAMVHDVIAVVGVYSVFQFKVTPGDRRRVPHDPRLLALRHDRRVRPGEGEPGEVQRVAHAVLRTSSTSR